MEQQNREIKELQEALNTERLKMEVRNIFIVLYCIVLYLFQKIKPVTMCVFHEGYIKNTGSAGTGAEEN